MWRSGSLDLDYTTNEDLLENTRQTTKMLQNKQDIVELILKPQLHFSIAIIA